jgi:hypothetical protein
MTEGAQCIVVWDGLTLYDPQISRCLTWFKPVSLTLLRESEESEPWSALFYHGVEEYSRTGVSDDPLTRAVPSSDSLPRHVILIMMLSSSWQPRVAGIASA